MLTVLCSTPRPPLGVAILGLTIMMSSWMLHLLPYITFCGMIALSVWPPSHPLPADVMYYPINGHPNRVHMVYTRVGSKPSNEAGSFELDAELRILVFLLAAPVTYVVENFFFYPARSTFLRTIECWFDMRYVHPAQMAGSWPDTWTPVFNALRSCTFVADFIDAATGQNSGPSLAHSAATHSPGPLSGTDASGGPHSMAQPAEQKASSPRQCRRASSPDPIVHTKLECSTDAPRPRKTFVSPPHVSPQSPWKANGSGGFSPVSKNLSRVVGILFHYPPLRKPVIRCRINLMAKVPSARVPPQVVERLWSRNEVSVAPAWASMSSLGTAIRNSLDPWHNGAQLPRSAWDHGSNHLLAAVPEPGGHIARGAPPISMGSRFLSETCKALAIEQSRFEKQKCWGYTPLPLSSLSLPEPPIQTLPQDVVTDRQEEQYFHPWSMQTPVHHEPQYQDQQITIPPVYRQQELEYQSFHGIPSGLDLMPLVQHGSQVYSDVPERPMADQEPRASLVPVLETPLPPFSSLPLAPQEQFTFHLLDHVPLFEFSEDTPQLDHSPPCAPPSRPELPEMARTSDRYATTAVSVPCTTSQDESSHSPSLPVPFDAPPETVWTNYHHQSPTIASPVLQPCHTAQPFMGLGVTGTFTFDVSTANAYFDFSHHVPPSPAPHPDGIRPDVIPQEATAMSVPSNSRDVNEARSPISASCEYPPRQLSSDQGVQIQPTHRDPTSQPQEVVFNTPPRQPCVPAEQAGSATGDTATLGADPSTTGPNMEVDSDDGDDGSSDSNSSGSSDTEGDSGSDTEEDMDTDSDSDDSDSDSSSSDDDSDSDSDSDSSEDENNTVASKTVPKTSSRAPDASSKAQDDMRGTPTDKDTSAPAAAKDNGTNLDSDSDGYVDHVPTSAPPGASNNDDSSSSDEDMSDHEEEDRLYWEKFYTPRHRRQLEGSV